MTMTMTDGNDRDEKEEMDNSFFLFDLMNISILVSFLIFLNRFLNAKHENGSWFIENSYFCLDQNTGY